MVSGRRESRSRAPGYHRAGDADDGSTCVDELHVPLQVAVDHENLVAARVGAGPLPDLLVVLLDVLLQERLSERPAEPHPAERHGPSAGGS